MSHSFEHNKLISISLTNLHWIFSVILVIIEILFLCKNLQCLACFPKLWSYQIMNIIIMLSFKIFGLVCISRRLAITKLHLNHGKRWRATMEHPSHPQQKFFKQHTPPLPDLVWRNTEKIWWQKKKIENWGGGWGRFLREARVGCRWNNRWGRSFIVVVVIPSRGDSYSTTQSSFLYSFPHIFHFIS